MSDESKDPLAFLSEPLPTRAPRRWWILVVVLAGVVVAGVVVCLAVWGSGDSPVTSVPAGSSTAAPTTTTLTEVGYPALLWNPVMVFDPAVGRVVMFGGQKNPKSAPGDDTWLYDAAAGEWRHPGPLLRPSGRIRSVAVYVDSQGAVAMIGGAQAPAADCSRNAVVRTAGMGVWWFDAAVGSWSAAATSAVSPPDRWGAAAAYDPASDRLVLFGGTGTSFEGGNSELLGDTWVYDPAEGTWQEIDSAISPAPRLCHQMVYDPATGLIYLWGGRTEDRVGDPTMWTFDTSTGIWAAAASGPGPEPRWLHQMVYQPNSGLIYVMGGEWYQTTSTGAVTQTDLRPTKETWAFDPQTGQWHAQADVPGFVTDHAAAPTGDGRIVLFARGSTLLYDPATDRWQDVTPPDAFTTST